MVKILYKPHRFWIQCFVHNIIYNAIKISHFFFNGVIFVFSNSNFEQTMYPFLIFSLGKEKFIVGQFILGRLVGSTVS
jgi:hypothetical protein